MTVYLDHSDTEQILHRKKLDKITMVFVKLARILLYFVKIQKYSARNNDDS